MSAEGALELEEDDKWSLMDRYHRAVILIRSDGRILKVNPQCVKLLNSVSGIFISDDRLVIRDAEQEQRFRDLFCSDNIGSHCSVVIKSASPDTYVIFSGRCYETKGQKVAVLEVKSDQDNDASYCDLSKVFPLTKTEEKVVRSLLQGHKVTKIADMNQVKIETVRTQVRQIYSKLNVSSREALYAKLQPYRIT